MSETPEQAKTRRRWLTLAEMVAVSGLVIGAMTLWLNWSGRQDAAREKAATQAASKAAEARFALQAELARGGKEIRLSDPRHELLETVVAFPTGLKIEPQSPATARIERNWFATPVLAATDGGADSREGRLPVLVTASYRVGDAIREGRAIVEIVWSTHGRLIGGRDLEIEAVRLRENGGTVKRMDTLWSAEMRRQSARA